MASTDAALDHLEIGAAELLATAPEGWSETQRDRLHGLVAKIREAEWQVHRADYLRRTAIERGAT